MRMNRHQHLICLLIDWLVETGSHCVALIVLELTEIYRAWATPPGYSSFIFLRPHDVARTEASTSQHNYLKSTEIFHLPAVSFHRHDLQKSFQCTAHAAACYNLPPLSPGPGSCLGSGPLHLLLPRLFDWNLKSQTRVARPDYQHWPGRWRWG